MDNTRPAPTGTVHPTPEAGPLTPPTMRDHYAAPIPGYQPNAAAQAGTTATPEATVTSSGTGTGSQHLVPIAGGKSDQSRGDSAEKDPEEIARELGERLKPVMEAAEDVATKALDLSAKGLTKLVDMLEERRRNRDTTDQPDQSNPS